MKNKSILFLIFCLTNSLAFSQVGTYLYSPVIYAQNNANALIWYKHIGYTSGTYDWAANSGKKVGDGWNFPFVFSDGNSHLYAVKDNGDLVWYHHFGVQDGTYNWSQSSGTKVGTGWLADTKGVFAAGKGVIYLMKNNGDLLWYKHLGYQSGQGTWDPASGKKVGSGWNDFYAVFSGGDGIFYMVDKNGDLFWYKHVGISNGSNLWQGGNTNKVGNGWNSKWQIFSTGGGIIYCITSDGILQIYGHAGYNDGKMSWTNYSGNKVGNSWSGFKAIGLGSINPN